MRNKIEVVNSSKYFSLLTSFVIICSAIILGAETAFRQNKEVSSILASFDYLIILYFLIEISVRLITFHHNREELFHAVAHFLKKKAESGDKEIVKELFWLFFDGLILGLSLISLLENFIDHPEIIGVFRLLRVFRILRVFELSKSLKNVESKMLSVFPTVFIFIFLIFLIVYTYAIIGMHLYDYKKFDTLDFSSLYTAMSSLIVIMTNGVAGALRELKSGSPNINAIVTDVFIFTTSCSAYS